MSPPPHRVYYNEIDPFAASWLKTLIARRMIPNGEIDTRSIADVTPADLAGYTQCHFFAGIGGWAYALALAGWPWDRPVWTGSCPCQPFSSAGKGGGFADERHLWPAWHWLIEQCRPATIVGEQVASPAGRGWWDLVATDAEALGYACAAVVLPAASVEAPHLRERLWWVAGADDERSQGWRRAELQERAGECAAGKGGASGRGMADTNQRTSRQGRQEPRGWDTGGDADTGTGSGGDGDLGELADTEHAERRPLRLHREDERNRKDVGRAETHGQSGTRRQVRGVAHSHGRKPSDGGVQRSGRYLQRGEDETIGQSMAHPHRQRIHAPVHRPRLPRTTDDCAEALGNGKGNGNFWLPAEWIPCVDGKSRPVEPGTFPLAHGVPARVGRLRGYGNAIVPHVAAAFIQAFLDGE